MKSRLSLTVDPRVTHRAKRYAQANNKSLSALVEELLEVVANPGLNEAASEGASFSERWSKQLKPARKEAIRYQRLAEKYDML